MSQLWFNVVRLSVKIYRQRNILPVTVLTYFRSRTMLTAHVCSMSYDLTSTHMLGLAYPGSMLTTRVHRSSAIGSQ